MACAKPLLMCRYADGTFGWSAHGRDVVSMQPVSCGQCAMCRAQLAAEWTTRIYHEGQSSPASLCATLTYSSEKLPVNGSLSLEDVVLWVKRLRRQWRDATGEQFRFHLFGEYSPAPLRRPHYHVCLFGYWPDDGRPWNKSQAGNPQFESPSLTASWGKGHVTFQEFSAGAAGYCAGHQAFKLTGRKARDELAVLTASGHWAQRLPEFMRCSRMPGIGAGFFERYGEQMLRLGFTVVDGRQVPVPDYYLRLADRVPKWRELVLAARAKRELGGWDARADSTPERLVAREGCAQARLDRAVHRDG